MPCVTAGESALPDPTPHDYREHLAAPQPAQRQPASLPRFLLRFMARPQRQGHHFGTESRVTGLERARQVRTDDEGAGSEGEGSNMSGHHHDLPQQRSAFRKADGRANPPSTASKAHEGDG